MQSSLQIKLELLRIERDAINEQIDVLESALSVTKLQEEASPTLSATTPPVVKEPGPFDRAGATAGQPASREEPTLDLSEPQEGDAPYFGYSWPKSETEGWSTARRKLLHLQEQVENYLSETPFLATHAWSDFGLRIDLRTLSDGLCRAQVTTALRLVVRLRLYKEAFKLLKQGAKGEDVGIPWQVDMVKLKVWFQGLGGDLEEFEKRSRR